MNYQSEYFRVINSKSGGVKDSHEIPFVVTIFGPVTGESTSDAIMRILKLSSLDKKREIQLYVNSPGGDVHAGLAVIDTCRHVSNPVSTVGIGLCASMGAMILSCAGTPGRRFILPHAEVMIHQPWTGVQGQASDIEIAAAHIAKLKKTLYGLLSQATGLPNNEIEKLGDRDRWFDSEEAVKYRLADSVLRKPGNILRKVDKLRKPGKPERAAAFEGRDNGLSL